MQDYACAVRSSRQGQGPPDAAARTSDQDHTVVQQIGRGYMGVGQGRPGHSWASSRVIRGFIQPAWQYAKRSKVSRSAPARLAREPRWEAALPSAAAGADAMRPAPAVAAAWSV